MAARTRKIAQPTNYHCRDCSQSYDWGEIGHDGKPFMCKCPFYKEGRFYKFLDDKQCDKFKLKQNEFRG